MLWMDLYVMDAGEPTAGFNRVGDLSDEALKTIMPALREFHNTGVCDRLLFATKIEANMLDMLEGEAREKLSSKLCDYGPDASEVDWTGFMEGTASVAPEVGKTYDFVWPSGTVNTGTVLAVEFPWVKVQWPRRGLSGINLQHLMAFHMVLPPVPTRLNPSVDYPDDRL